MNAIEAGELQRPKQMKDVATSRRFILEALQKAGMVSLDGHKWDSCLMHPGRFEISEGNKGEQHVCMKSVNNESLTKPKLLVIHFTRDAASQKTRGSRPISSSKPVPFPYQSDMAVPWIYAPQKPSERKEEATSIDLLSAKVTNITGLSSVTNSGCVFVAPNPSVKPTDVKGKMKVVMEETNKVGPSLEEDVPNNDGVASLIEFKENRGRFGLSYKPTRACWIKSTRDVSSLVLFETLVDSLEIFCIWEMEESKEFSDYVILNSLTREKGDTKEFRRLVLCSFGNGRRETQKEFRRSQVVPFLVKLMRQANAIPLTITLKKFISWGISRGKGTLKEGFQASSKVLIINKDSGGHTLTTSSIKTKVTMSNHKSTESALKNLEIANKSSNNFGANTENNPKEDCKAMMTRSKRFVEAEDEENVLDKEQMSEKTGLRLRNMM
ncbi:hypothetical protein HKD37_14G040190 [Glycine soja]